MNDYGCVSIFVRTGGANYPLREPIDKHVELPGATSTTTLEDIPERLQVVG
jgi:hypothetical protein